MANGLFEISHSDVCVAISGECGNFEKEAEFKAYIAIKYNNVLFNYEIKCFGYRDKIKENYVLKVYEILNNIL